MLLQASAFDLTWIVFFSTWKIHGLVGGKKTKTLTPSGGCLWKQAVPLVDVEPIPAIKGHGVCIYEQWLLYGNGQQWPSFHFLITMVCDFSVFI